jgi:DNA-directed RNA polymerase specialized sigma24 family protein
MGEAARSALRQMLAEADWEALVPLLVADAASRIRRSKWLRGRDELPAAAEAEELVQDIIAIALSNRRVLPDDMDLLTFLRGLLWSELWNRRRAAKRRARVIGGEIPDAVEDEKERADEALGRRALLARVEKLIEDDEELLAFYGAMAQEHTKRNEIAEALGWTSDRVSAVRKKLNRRLASAGLLEGEGGEP